MRTLGRTELATSPAGHMLPARARFILLALIPLLWLAASLSRSTAASSLLPADDHVVPTLSSADFGEHGLGAAAISSEQMVRRATRRFGDGPSSNGFATIFILQESRIVPTVRAARPVSLPRASAPLASNWQFHWRTAPDSRAPSFAS